MLRRFRFYNIMKNSKLVRLESRNEGIEDFNEEMEWDASERLWNVDTRLWNEDRVDAGDFFCTNFEGFCYSWFTMWVHHCPNCGHAVAQETSEDEPL